MPELLSAETGGQSRRDHLGAATLERIQQDTTTLVLPQERGFFASFQRDAPARTALVLQGSSSPATCRFIPALSGLPVIRPKRDCAQGRLVGLAFVVSGPLLPPTFTQCSSTRKVAELLPGFLFSRRGSCEPG